MLDIFAELSGLTRGVNDATAALCRIADALERLSPPLPEQNRESVPAPSASGAPASEFPDNEQPGFTFAESPAEYQSRVSAEADLALYLGVAPWSPSFQQTILEMRRGLMQPHTERIQDEQGEWHWSEQPGRTEEEADTVIRDAFRLARAEANVRSDSGVNAPATY